MFRSPLLALLWLALLVATPARADLLVLVHGWAADADTWFRSGVVPVLEGHGWRDGGVVVAGPGGVYRVGGRGDGERTVYRAQSIAEAPLTLQAGQLLAELRYLRARYPDQPLHLVGHSAGGLVARLALVAPGAPRVDTLITIATPNLGTGRALQGLEVAEGRPFFCPGPGVDFLKEMVGGGSYRYLRDSRAALVDLTPVAPGNLTDWLNRQPHPDIAYYAVVRQGGDALVPAFSQDLNQVPALRGRATLYLTPAGHGLTPADGELVARILSL
ncbi:esterase/lipase family protein [Endothiovibrio diazotrophicus]